MREPVFLASPRGLFLHANPAAARAFRAPPGWLTAWIASDGRAGLPRCVRAVPVDQGDEPLVLLVMELLDVEPEEAHLAPWAHRWGLPPRLARVACCLLRGMSDKEAAVALGLELNTVRTYVRQLFERARVSHRAELTAAALGVRAGGSGRRADTA